MLGECHGGLIIVDPQGLDSRWLRKEATVLSSRRAHLGERFNLITVLVGGVTRDQLKAAGLDWLLPDQIVKATQAEQAVVDVLEAFAAQATYDDKSPLANWIRDVAYELEGKKGLSAVADELDLEDEDRAQPDLARTVAHALLHAKPDTARRAL